jgi:hypothetical protein
VQFSDASIIRYSFGIPIIETLNWYILILLIQCTYRQS